MILMIFGAPKGLPLDARPMEIKGLFGNRKFFKHKEESAWLGS